MTRVLIAGIGNVFLSDDGFGVEVVDRLRTTPLPAGVEVLDVGIRAMHLAYQILEGYDLVVAVDVVARGGAPGTLYLIEPDLTASPPPTSGHGFDLRAVFGMVRALGGTLGRVLVVGCEPAQLGEGVGLSPAVERAVEPTARRVLELAKGAIPHEMEAS
jgi:hydrogenase maturation protease